MRLVKFSGSASGRNLSAVPSVAFCFVFRLRYLRSWATKRPRKSSGLQFGVAWKEAWRNFPWHGYCVCVTKSLSRWLLMSASAKMATRSGHFYRPTRDYSGLFQTFHQWGGVGCLVFDGGMEGLVFFLVGGVGGGVLVLTISEIRILPLFCFPWETCFNCRNLTLIGIVNSLQACRSLKLSIPVAGHSIPKIMQRLSYEKNNAWSGLHLHVNAKEKGFWNSGVKSKEKKTTSSRLKKKKKKKKGRRNDKALFLSRDFSVSILFELWLAHQIGSGKAF